MVTKNRCYQLVFVLQIVLLAFVMNACEEKAKEEKKAPPILIIVEDAKTKRRENSNVSVTLINKSLDTCFDDIQLIITGWDVKAEDDYWTFHRLRGILDPQQAMTRKIRLDSKVANVSARLRTAGEIACD